MNLRQTIQAASALLAQSKLAYGHGTQNALDEAAWLVLWQLRLPLDTQWDMRPHSDQTITATQRAQITELLTARIQTRKPAAYLTHEAWLQGIPFM